MSEQKYWVILGGLDQLGLTPEQQQKFENGVFETPELKIEVIEDPTKIALEASFTIPDVVTAHGSDVVCSLGMFAFSQFTKPEGENHRMLIGIVDSPATSLEALLAYVTPSFRRVGASNVDCEKLAKAEVGAILKGIVDGELIVQSGVLSRELGYTQNLSDANIADFPNCLKRLNLSQLPEEQVLNAPQAIMAGTEGSGGVARGCLATTPEQVEQLLSQGKKVIACLNSGLNHHQLAGLWDKLSGLVAIGDTPAHFFNATQDNGLPYICASSTGDLQSLAGTMVTIQGNPPQLFLGNLQSASPALDQLTALADRCREQNTGVSVHANVGTVEQARVAIDSGADGFGLIRTENLLTSAPTLRQQVANAILEQEPTARATALDAIDQIHVKQLQQVFEQAVRLQTTNFQPTVRVRLFDAKPEELFGENPPTEHRGVQFGMSPEGQDFYKHQIGAIFKAAQNAGLEEVQIMVPTVRTQEELDTVKGWVESMQKDYPQVSYKFGVMVETAESVNPKMACYIAQNCDFVSFGTNDLTSEIEGLSREGREAIRNWQIQNQTSMEPLKQFTPKVKEAMRSFVKIACQENTELSIGICGQHVSEVEGIAFAQELGVNSISVSPNPVTLAVARVEATRQEMLPNLLASDEDGSRIPGRHVGAQQIGTPTFEPKSHQ